MKKVIPFLCAIIIFIMTLMVIYDVADNNFISVLNRTWDINIPNYDRYLYYKNNDDKTIKYSIIEYNSENKMKNFMRLDFMYEKNSILEGTVKNIISTLDLNEKHQIDFNQKYIYYIKKLANNQELYIIYIELLNKVYIIEKS